MKYLNILLVVILFLSACSEDDPAKDSFTLGISGLSTKFVETSMPGSPTGYDPYIYAQLDITNTGTGELEIEFEHQYTGSTPDESISVSVDGEAAGNYTTGGGKYSGALGDFQEDDGLVFSTIDITLTSVGGVGQRVIGSFDVSLCLKAEISTGCGSGTTQFIGSFDATRIPNKGTAQAPKDLVLTELKTHRVATAYGGTNHYFVPVTASSSYTIDLSTLTDNVDLQVYDNDSSFTTPGTCDGGSSMGNAGTTAETCTITATGDVLYFTVTYAGGGTEADYDVTVN